MNAFSLILISSTVAICSLSADTTTKKNVLERLKDEYRYVPPAKAPPVDVSDDVVIMEAFTVVESGERRDLDRVLSEQERRSKEERYTIIKGGTLFKADVGSSRIEIGTWSGGGGLEFLRISW